MLFRKLFIPSLQNNLQPYSLRQPVLSVVALLIITAEIALIVYGTLAFTVPNSSLTAAVAHQLAPAVRELVPAALADLTNSYRAGRDLPPLAVNRRLQAAAQAKAEDLARRGSLPRGAEEPWSWLNRAGYVYREAGENTAVNFSDGAELLRSWAASPGHAANLFNPNYREVGVGVASGLYRGRPATFVVEFLASPRRLFASSPPARSGALAFIAAAPKTAAFYLVTSLITVVLVLLGILLVSIFSAHRALSWGKRLWEPFLLYRSQVFLIALLILLALILIWYNHQ